MMSDPETFQHLPELPVREVLPSILASLEVKSNLVLMAPPGAGKTTLVPLALLDAPWRAGRKILMLEPRRLAARSAAHRMASLLGESVGERVGYRVRFDTKVSPSTIIEVVTEGVFFRLLASDPGLEDIAVILFDEFHERSLDGDLALALCLDLQQGLRDDLRLLPMSATLDGTAVSQLVDAPLITSEGRTFPIEISYRDRRPQTPIEASVCDAIFEQLETTTTGDLLVFLPGQGEIERTHRRLQDKLPKNVDLHRLYGAVKMREQDAAIRKGDPNRRKVVLSSAIAETSLTIEGVTTVIDSGLARLPVFEPATGLTKLTTTRASQASIEQRAGRSGRTGPGTAIRLWRKEQTAGLPKQTPPEILNADLTALLLELADWGISEPEQLKWLDSPPIPAVNEARTQLRDLSAISLEGKITSHGRSMRQFPFPPRLSHMVVKGAEHSSQSAKRAALLALLIQERGVGGNLIDLASRCENCLQSRDVQASRILKQASNLVRGKGVNLPDEDVLSYGLLLAHAFTDRISQNRGSGPDGAARFRLANGRGAELAGDQALAKEAFVVAVDLIGKAGAAKIVSAAALSKEEIVSVFSPQMKEHVETQFDVSSKKLRVTKSSKLGALALERGVKIDLPSHEVSAHLVVAIAKLGLEILPWSAADRQFRSRLLFLHSVLPNNWPDVSDEALLNSLDDWLGPYLTDVSLGNLPTGVLSGALNLLAGSPSPKLMNESAPSHFLAPSGSSIPLQYEETKVVLSVRPQELFGLKIHPTIARGQVALELALISPAGRPIQITTDLPGFWQGSWRDVRSEMRGRYPKHPWPDDPANAQPTQRVKPRKN